MSIAARALPITRTITPRRHLRPVSNTVPRTKAAVNTRVRSIAQAEPRLARKAIVGAVAVLVAYLGVTVLCNQAIYDISSLKKQSLELSTKTQIVQQQVDSLRSPQNLADSARGLGMIVNSNPVFLKVATGKVLGSAVPASYSSSSLISSNMIANAALIEKSRPTKVSAPKLSVPQLAADTAKSVAPKTTVVKVVLPSAGIPASPTH